MGIRAILENNKVSYSSTYKLPQIEGEELDENILRCGLAVTQSTEYTHWHERLVIRKAEFDEARSLTMKQWWSD